MLLNIKWYCLSSNPTVEITNKLGFNLIIVVTNQLSAADSISDLKQTVFFFS